MESQPITNPIQTDGHPIPDPGHPLGASPTAIASDNHSQAPAPEVSLETQPSSLQANGQVTGHANGTPPPLKLPDWTPLGHIRDYFAEQIRQDGFR